MEADPINATTPAMRQSRNHAQYWRSSKIWMTVCILSLGAMSGSATLQSDDAGPASQFVFRIDVSWLAYGPEAEERDERLEFLVQMDQPFRVLHSQEDAVFVVEGVLTDAEDGKVLLRCSIVYQRGWTKARVNTEPELTPGIEKYVGAAGPSFTVTLLPPELDSAPPDTP